MAAAEFGFFSPATPVISATANVNGEFAYLTVENCIFSTTAWPNATAAAQATAANAAVRYGANACLKAENSLLTKAGSTVITKPKGVYVAQRDLLDVIVSCKIQGTTVAAPSIAVYAENSATATPQRTITPDVELIHAGAGAPVASDKGAFTAHVGPVKRGQCLATFIQFNGTAPLTIHELGFKVVY